MKNIIRTIKEWSKLLKYSYYKRNNQRFYRFLNGLDNQTKFDYMYLTTPWHQAVIDSREKIIAAKQKCSGLCLSREAEEAMLLGLEDNKETTWLRLAARTTINNMAAIDHYDYLESEQKGLGDWWLLEEAKDLVYRLEKIVGDFNPNEF